MTVQLNTDPQPFGPDHTPFDAIGGEARVRELTDAFYDRMDTEAYAHLRALHDDDLAESRDKLFMFLCGWMGGPQLYIERFGHPRLRMRHAHVTINEQGANEWIACMGEAMDSLGVEGDLRTFLDARFAHTANFMRNA